MAYIAKLKTYTIIKHMPTASATAHEQGFLKDNAKLVHSPMLVFIVRCKSLSAHGSISPMLVFMVRCKSFSALLFWMQSVTIISFRKSTSSTRPLGLQICIRALTFRPRCLNSALLISAEPRKYCFQKPGTFYWISYQILRSPRLKCMNKSSSPINTSWLCSSAVTVWLGQTFSNNCSRF